MASYTTEQMKRALLGSVDEQGEEQMGLFGYLAAPGQYLRGGLSDVISWLPGGVPAHGFTGRKMWGDDVLQEHGMVNKPGLDATDVLGFGMDMVVDPLNLFMGAGLAKGGVKLARMLPKLASKAGRAESLAAAKTALGAVPGALKRHAAPLGLGIGGMFGGGALMANNPEGSDWKDLLGMGMMTAPLVAPLAMAAGRRARPTAREVLQPELAAATPSPVSPVVPPLPLPESYAEQMKSMLIEHGFSVRPNVTKAGGSTNVKFDIFRGTDKIGDAITSFTDNGMSLSWIGTKGKTGLMNPYFSSAAKFAAEHGIPVRMKDSSKTGITGAKFMQHFPGAVAKPKSKYEWNAIAAEEALGAIPGAAMRQSPAIAYSIGAPVGGAYLMANNEEGSDLKDLVGMGLMASPLMLPLAMAAGRKAKGGTAAAKEALQPTKSGPFYSRLEEALLNAPEKFETRPEAVRVKPGRTIKLPDGTTKVIPDQQVVTPGATAYDQMRSYLEGRAHPQEVEWVLGDKFADQPTIDRQSLLDAYQQGKINLETERRGGELNVHQSGYNAGVRGANDRYFLENGVNVAFDDKGAQVFADRSEAARIARLIKKDYESQGKSGVVPVVRKAKAFEHGPLTFPDMLIPGGKNATEVPIRLSGVGKSLSDAEMNEIKTMATTMSKDELAGNTRFQDLMRRGQNPREGFPDKKGHFGDDVVAWTIHDQRKMPDGKTATFIQELQSDWHQQGAKTGYQNPRRLNELDNKLKANGKLSADEASEYNRLIELESFSKTTGSVPDAPFKGNEWTKLGIKQALADAAARGDDYVLLPPPELVSKTQGMPIEKARKFYGEIVPNLTNEMLKPFGTNLEKMPLPGARGQPDTLGFRVPDAMKKQIETKGFPLMSFAPAAGGAAILGMNENDDPAMNAIGTALLLGGSALPLAMAAKPLRKWSKKSVAEALAAEDAKSAMPTAPTAGEHGVLPISRPEIDFLEQLGIRDATKWQEIKRMLAGADARTPEAQAVIQQFLPR